MTCEERHETYCRIWLVAITILHAVAFYLLIRPMPESAADYSPLSSFTLLRTIGESGSHYSDQPPQTF